MKRPLPSQYKSREIICSLRMRNPLAYTYGETPESLDAPEWMPAGSMVSTRADTGGFLPVIAGVYRRRRA